MYIKLPQAPVREYVIAFAFCVVCSKCPQRCKMRLPQIISYEVSPRHNCEIRDDNGTSVGTVIKSKKLTEWTVTVTIRCLQLVKHVVRVTVQISSFFFDFPHISKTCLLKLLHVV